MLSVILLGGVSWPVKKKNLIRIGRNDARITRSAQMFYKIFALKNFAKFTGKHFCKNLVFKGVVSFVEHMQTVSLFFRGFQHYYLVTC